MVVKEHMNFDKGDCVLMGSIVLESTWRDYVKS